MHVFLKYDFSRYRKFNGINFVKRAGISNAHPTLFY